MVAAAEAAGIRTYVTLRRGETRSMQERAAQVNIILRGLTLFHNQKGSLSMLQPTLSWASSEGMLPGWIKRDI